MKKQEEKKGNKNKKEKNENINKKRKRKKMGGRGTWSQVTLVMYLALVAISGRLYLSKSYVVYFLCYFKLNIVI